ncbi:DNA-processing protein DprA [Vagococcus intermedius]|nr:DNA-processing protein DprA [Vagococcus intermedius]WEG76251.1 DNA-processing protein DprA [Vagococcus intermedius]
MSSLKFFIFLMKHVDYLSNAKLLKLISKVDECNCWEMTTREIAGLAEIAAPKLTKFLKSMEMIFNRKDSLYMEYLCGGFVTILDDDYPNTLREIYNPPAAFFYLGDIDLLKYKSIAIVGAREATWYGKRVTRELVRGLVDNCFVTVSGMALGIDTYVHEETIIAKGKTIAVVGCGFDTVYPIKNARLHEEIACNHLIITEYIRTSRPLPFHFPSRNRIIAGISKGTCIVEAKKRSGSLITAQLALDMGHEVFAVPGNILLPSSEGCHKLIQDGAKCVTCFSDILEEFYN